MVLVKADLDQRDRDQREANNSRYTNGESAKGQITGSTAPENHMEPNWNENTTANTSASVAGNSRSDFTKQVTSQTGETSQTKEKAQLRLTFDKEDQFPVAAASQDEINTSLQSLKDTATRENQADDLLDEIRMLTDEIEKRSPLDAQTRLDFGQIFKSFQSCTLEYQQNITQLAEELQDLDEMRNAWLEGTYILDSARLTSNFTTLQTVIGEHEEYIEMAKANFLESLNSIRVILGLD